MLNKFKDVTNYLSIQFFLNTFLQFILHEFNFYRKRPSILTLAPALVDMYK
jgi:hypothetical protein